MRCITAATIAAAGLAVGCTKIPPSHVDQHWGEAMQLNVSTMIANPEAGGDEPVEGLDPVTAQQVSRRYYQSQQQESPKEVRTFLVEGSE